MLVGRGNAMIALGYDSDRKFLFVGGALVALVWSLLFFQTDMRNITHLWGFNALSDFLATHNLRWYQSYCVFLVVLVLRPSGEWRFYYGALFGAFLLVALPVAMVNDSFKPAFVLDGFDPPKDKPGRSAVSEGVPIYGANGTKWADIVSQLPGDLNRQGASFNESLRKEGYPEKLNAGDMLSDPDGAAARLKRLQSIVTSNRVAFAKIVTDFDAALMAEQKNGPSPLMKTHLDRAAREGARYDADMAMFEKILAEFSSIHHDLTHPVGQIESKGDRIYFTSEEDQKTWQRHQRRMARLAEQQKAARSKPPSL